MSRLDEHGKVKGGFVNFHCVGKVRFVFMAFVFISLSCVNSGGNTGSFYATLR